MSFSWRWLLGLVAILLFTTGIAGGYQLNTTSPSFMLSCSSELYNRNNETQDSNHYLLVDLLSKDGQVQVHYRYFNIDGTTAGTVSMQGQVNHIDNQNRIYDISVNTKQESPLAEDQQPPEHYRYLSYVSNLNLSRDGMHNLSLQVLEQDDAKDFAVVLFQPSNTVCGCRLVN
ncbi:MULTISPECIES: hypothetical protein [Shewanella]|uniref:FidL-like membrane protein n=1 Tax=Shewanella japonica TaxID=93973 RepID=A0ABM6JI05_9GAMM|nr:MULTISPECIES: hypothetical protein [Shewanella]ARD21169.1 hypothetical protein SJ2017_0837 [Shewanella japonica]KPZ73438.1 hypothetical protein AN944_00022 [Shewanella sp. P1-14-1]MBQ4890430.1 hypothetical protein [Shewanella sp. MMG014]OBT07047.1 hypothetical protein A9267_14335 [Shewanella sp. UCD-FRSSP16_17]